MLADRFADGVLELLHRLRDEQLPLIDQAAAMIARSIASGGIVRIFGTGHSHLIAEEVFYRAGVLAPVDAILEPSLTGQVDVTKSEVAERLEGWGRIIVEHRRMGPEDVLLVISNSGRNAAPVEVAMEAKERGIPVVAVTSKAFSAAVPSRHRSGKRLFEVADLVLDNGAPFGDAILNVPGLPVPVGPVSGIAGMFIVHCLLVQAVEHPLRLGVTPPVLMSGNRDEGRDYNEAVLARYWDRIRGW
ncbi:SIS domain-containing protein [Thermaerobacter sp. PB12/4term]|uniref:sugar isomerase domain-containing protein n=1 Tax=Thermaerobacter sp. PB12/4term TaxID=2293838 RepID=UPI00131465B9|nr:SIS domain-containing protein [Thermaerobacter sp. PB12/4term]QIA26714.1 SIS domain-containing protein [Thermaerobacter sp. PB12/4term]